MRKDMAKIIVSRPRSKGYSYKTYSNIRAKNKLSDYDSLPSKEGMRRPYTPERKEFNDYLHPLNRFIESCVGRKWNDVWSEICNVTPNNTMGKHLKDHILQRIEIHTEMIDGKVARKGKRFWFLDHFTFFGPYVHPITGIVCCNNLPKKD